MMILKNIYLILEKYKLPMPRILIIEDETQIRKNLQQILELSDYKVLTAANGLIGIEIAKTQLPDLILCDIMLPELDGYGVLASLREDKATALIPVIFLTAKAERTEQRLGMELGADDYLTKPFNTDEVLQAITTRLARTAAVNRQYAEQIEQNKTLEKEVQAAQEKLEKSLKVSALQTDVLAKVTEDLRNPLSNINIAIHMLKQAPSQKERERYLKVLQEECRREIEILNEMEHLQKLLTPENTKLLQRWNLIKE
jgi:two-component system alkaline phosphatase synthesis response regulator PhoP